jgi:hypothetical protein
MPHQHGKGDYCMHAGGNGVAYDDADSRWMSYPELAEARRITTSSAIKLVMRRGWRRQQDNQGIMRALVPSKWAEPAPGRDFDPGAHLTQALEALEASVGALRERAETAEQVAQFERERANRSDQAQRAELSRGNYLRDKIDVLRADLAEAQRELELARYEVFEAMQTAAELRQADERWRTLGRVARLREAWRSVPSSETAGTE